MRPANERRRYNATPSLFGWVHTQNAVRYNCKGIIHVYSWTHRRHHISTLTNEQWGICYAYFKSNWPCYNEPYCITWLFFWHRPTCQRPGLVWWWVIDKRVREFILESGREKWRGKISFNRRGVLIRVLSETGWNDRSFGTAALPPAAPEILHSNVIYLTLCPLGDVAVISYIYI